MGKWIEQHTERRNVYKWYEVLGEILYVVSVVGGVVNHTGVIYGTRIHRTVALRRRIMAYTFI